MTSSFAPILSIRFWLLVSASWPTLLGAAEPIRVGGEPVEILISEVSPRTVRIELISVEGRGRNEAAGAASSTVLVPFATTEKLRLRELSGEQETRVGALRVQLRAAPLQVSVRNSDGRLVQHLTFETTSNAVAFHMAGPVFGLGEGAQQFNRRGALYPMEPSWGGWNRPVLGSVVPSPFLIGPEGWALFVHRPEGQFDLRGEEGRFLPSGRSGLDLFVVNVEEPSDALAEYIRLTGRPVLPPKWAFGYFQSHRTLAGPEEAVQIARLFREKHLPCDALIYLGTGYCTNGWNRGHGSLAFNPNSFAQPERDLRALHDLNFKVVLHVNRAPRELFGASISEPSDSPRHLRNYWARHRELIDLGVDGWWPDDGDELPLEARLTRHRCYYEGPIRDRPNVRPWSLHRTGYAGSQRYGGWIWSGDIDGKWETLAAHVSIGLNHGLSLTPFWGSDTGGFYPTRDLTGELYVRWFQFSAFCASFRSHGRTWKLRLPWGWNTGEFGPIEHPRSQHPDAAALHNAEVEPIARKYLELRYRLLPYNYTLARAAVDTGLPMMRALWLHYPKDPEAVNLGTEYLWGRDLLVAPVVEKGAQVRRLYLPDGQWFDWWTGEKLSGRRWVERPVDLATIPLYARAGAIVPLDPVRQYTAEPATEPTTLRVFPGANGVATLYDDDGQSLGYRDNTDPQTVWIRLRWDDAARLLSLDLDPRQAQWSGKSRFFRVEIAGANMARPVEFRGMPVEVRLSEP